jgi:hypothetical protein
MTTIQYRKLRRIMLRVARSYRFGSWVGPADMTELKKQQRAMVNLRCAYRA